MARIGHDSSALIAARSTGNGRDLTWALVTVASALGLAIWMRGFEIDDSLISIRYARHLASGVGYRFNEGGPQTDGVTPLVWPWLLAPFAKAPALLVLSRAKALGLAAWLMAAGGWGMAVGRARAHVAVKCAAVALLAICVPIAAHAVSGMETPVAMALATAAAIAVDPWKAAALAGLAAALRPEMAPWAMALAVGLGSRRHAFVRALLAIEPFALCVAARLVIFGRAAPLSLMAKPSDVAHGLAYAGAAALVSLAPIVALSPIALARRWDRASALVAAGVVHYLAIIAVGGDWMPYARLAATIAPSLLYAFVLVSPRVPPILSAIRVAAAAALAGFLLFTRAQSGRHVLEHVNALVADARPYLADAHHVAALDVGWVSAATDATLVDLAGVTDPEIAALPGGHTSKRVDVSMLLARDVDAILLYVRSRCDSAATCTYSRVVEARLADADLLAEKYETRAFLPFGTDGAGYLLLTKR